MTTKIAIFKTSKSHHARVFSFCLCIDVAGPYAIVSITNAAPQTSSIYMFLAMQRIGGASHIEYRNTQDMPVKYSIGN